MSNETSDKKIDSLNSQLHSLDQQKKIERNAVDNANQGVKIEKERSGANLAKINGIREEIESIEFKIWWEEHRSW